MRSYPFESGDLPSLSLRDGSMSGAVEVICSDADAPEMSDAMMLMPPVVSSIDDDDHNSIASSSSSKKKTWDELAAAAGSVLISPSSASSVVSDLSVLESPFMEVIDMLLAGKSKEEEHLFLREMVVDLMTEVDQLKQDLENSMRGSEGRIIANKNLFSLLSKTKDANPVAAAKKKVADMIKKRDQLVSEEEATEMVIQQLTKKIEEQNLRNSDYVASIKKLEKQLELFKTACRARGSKIVELQTELEKVKEQKKKEEDKMLAKQTMAKENTMLTKNGAEFVLPVRTIAPLPPKQGDKIAAFTKVLTKPYAFK
ncbi:hypothetical protein MPSEU_000153500 [Mayamaea pseudoterrestris]|nr:hypothetical protein MPSEU_000153500 [Mayamaea pseudoterrestris]